MKEKSISKLKQEADTIFSQYIRKKYANWKDEVKCFTCDKTFPLKAIQNGHYISRVYTNLRWAEINCRPQCISCNLFKRGNMDEYAVRLEAETPGILKQLRDWKHRESTPLKREDLLATIKEFKEKIKLIGAKM